MEASAGKLNLLDDRRVGDAVNVLAIASMLGFSATVAAQLAGWTGVLDDSFMRDGFCVANQDMSVYWQSHMLCFYGDTGMSASVYSDTDYSDTVSSLPCTVGRKITF